MRHLMLRVGPVAVRMGLWHVRNAWKLLQVELGPRNVVMVVPTLGFVVGVIRHENTDDTGSWSVFIGPIHIEWCWRN